MSRQLQKLRMWTGQPVNAPFATPPMALRFVLLGCVLSVTGTLMYGVFSQLGHTDWGALSGFQMALRIAAFFLLPVLIAVTISTNRAISRILILIFSLLLTHQVVTITNSGSLDSKVSFYLVTTLSVFLIGIIWWLFRSKRMRFYYSMISTGDLPDDLVESVEELTSPSRFEQEFSRVGNFVAPFLEIAILIIGIIAIIFMFDMTGWIS